MANKFNKPYLTNVGREMIVAVGAGKGTITYTKAVLYDQSVNNLDPQQIQATTSLNGERKEVEVGLVDNSDNSVTISASFNNKGLTSDITFNSVGWFAKSSVGDGAEHLIAISPTASQAYLASQAPDNTSIQTIDLKLYMAISNDANITVLANDDNMVTQEELKQSLSDQANIYDTKLANMGTVKSVSVNGGTATKPDVNGNINISVQQTVDLSGFVTKSDLDKLRNDVTNGNTGNYTKATIDNLLSAKADKLDTYTKTETSNLINTSLSLGKYISSINGQTGNNTGTITVKGTKVSSWDFTAPESVQTVSGVDITSLDAMTADDLRKIIGKFTDQQNQLNQLKSNQFETQTFTDETSAKNWEAQRPGMRLAIINS